MPVNLTPWLEKLESAIDLAWEREKIATWKRFLDFQPFPQGFPPPTPTLPPPQKGDWPAFSINQAIRDPYAMALQQLGGVYQAAVTRSWNVPCIRSNYGTGILPSLFGAETFWMDEALNTLPTSRPLQGADAIRRLLDAGVPNLEAGFGRDVFQTAALMRQAIAPYPKINEITWMYHPDIQGPVDVLELLWGSDMFYAFVDEPALVHDAMTLVTETYIRFLRRWLAENPPKGDGRYMAHWGYFCKGQVFLREDSIVNLSVSMYEEFIQPHDARVFKTFGGGGIHFCGREDHAIESMTSTPGLNMVQMSQPHLNDMPRIVRATIGRGIPLVVRFVDSMKGLDLTRGYFRAG